MFNLFRKKPSNADAFITMRVTAENGDALAQFELGTMYLNGDGTDRNVSEGLKWYRKAAEQDCHPTPQFILGMIYMNGELAPADLKEAFRWFHKAANHGHAEAQSNLGLLLSLGKGVAQNDGEAVRWFHSAAEQGFAEAQGYLGLMYAEGRGGLCQDFVEAYKWINLAAKDSDPRHVRAREGLSKIMTREQIAEGQRRAATFVK